MKATIKFKKDSPYKGITTVIDDVIEIHYNYPSYEPNRIAFECVDTGYTHLIDDIEEFECK